MPSPIYRACPKSHVPVGVPRSSNGEAYRDGTWEVTTPVGSAANRRSEDALKQRRCGPFWCLPVVQRPGLLKRHTLIAGSAERVSQSKPRQTKRTEAGQGQVHRRVKRVHESGVSTGWFHGKAIAPLSTAGSRGRERPSRSLIARAEARQWRDRWPPSASSTSSPPDVRTARASSSTSTSCATISAPSRRRCRIPGSTTR